MIKDFLWKYINIDDQVIEDLKKLSMDNLPNNDHFFQEIKIKITEFLGLKLQRCILIQVAPNAIGRIHTDWRPDRQFGDRLALNIALENCENSLTEFWKSDSTPPTQYTSNGQPYRYFDAKACVKISEFKLIKPTLFRTDIPHSVSNYSNHVRRAISLRFKEDPWDLI